MACLTAAFAAKSFLWVAFLDPVVSVFAIAYLLIQLRVGLGWAPKYDSNTAGTMSAITFAPTFAPTSPDDSRGRQNDGGLRVRILQEREVDGHKMVPLKPLPMDSFEQDSSDRS